MTDGLVLVTGAAGGRQGRSGRYVFELLRARGVPVRAFVHTTDERSDQLRALGAEVVEGDFLDYHSVRRAVEGVSSVYFAYPVQAGLLDATAINQHAVDHLSQLWRAIRIGANRFEATDTIEKLGGRKAKTFEKFVRDEQDAFTSPILWPKSD
jgi:uncharacterized protein YbjT (DUF2867 family)